jgi:hypothetical protein
MTSLSWCRGTLLDSNFTLCLNVSFEAGILMLRGKRFEDNLQQRVEPSPAFRSGCTHVTFLALFLLTFTYLFFEKIAGHLSFVKVLRSIAHLTVPIPIPVIPGFFLLAS